MDFCGKSNGLADFENTVDRGSAVIFDADSGLCRSSIWILGPKRHLDHRFFGSCVLRASVGRVSVDTINRYGDRHSADISTDTRPICRPSVGRVSVDMLF